MPDPNNSSSDNTQAKGSDSNAKSISAVSVDGKVLIGLGLIFAAAIISTLYVMTVSVSPQIHLSQSDILGTSMAASSQSDQMSPNSQQKIDKKFVLIQGDFTWNHTSPGPTIKVNKGDVVQILVVNAGHMAHNLGIGMPSEKTKNLMMKIKDLPLAERTAAIPYDDLAQMPCPGCQPKFEEGHIKSFMPPETQMVTTFTASEAGHFKYFCMVRGHIWLGMIGDFVVEEASSSNTEAATSDQGNGGVKV